MKLKFTDGALLLMRGKGYKKIFITVFISLILAGASYPQTKHKVLEYLYSISGNHTIAGQESMQYTDSMYAITGHYAGLWGEDFSFSFWQNTTSMAQWRSLLVSKAKDRWAKGDIIALMFHACPPTGSEPCNWDGGPISKLTDAQWSELITDGTTLNNNWKARLDAIVPFIQDLQNAGIEVLFRPLHEMNQGAFWWGGRPGPNGSARLYQITHDYLVKTKGLTNLIFVWNLQDFSTLSSDVNTYDPGSDYWDVLALDVYYSDGTGYTSAKYNTMVNKAAGRPIAIGECGTLPNVNLLKTQPLWTYFMGWSELTQEDNTNSAIYSVYNSANVITEDKMPEWKSYCAYSGAPYTIPGTIEAENYDNCGAGISYYDTDTTNTGKQYRTGGVDIENATGTGGGYDVTDIHSGEWLNYAVNVDTAGVYTIQARVASAAAGKTFHIELDGEDVSGEITVPNTGSAQQWTTVSVTTPQLSTGLKIMRIVMDADSFSIDNVKFSISDKAPLVAITSPVSGAKYIVPATVKLMVTASDADGSVSKVEYYHDTTKIGESSNSPFTYVWASVPKGSYLLSAAATDNSGLRTQSDTVRITVSLSEQPYDTIPYPIPGRIEAENYDIGGEGVAYHDLTSGNKFNVYRSDDVDLETCTDTTGGYSLGDFTTGEWVQYTVNVEEAGNYDIEFRVASQQTGTAISLMADSVDITGKLVVPNTGGWQTWKSMTKTGVALTSGKKILRLNSLAQYANINYITFSQSATGTEKWAETLPKEINLYQNYPNPFNPTTNIRYDVPKDSYVLIKVYNILGKEISTLVREDKQAGSYEVHFDGSRLSSGVYFYTIRVGSYVNTKQMVLVK